MHPELAAIEARQYGVFRRRQALMFYAPREVQRLLDRGEWVRVRHGIYATRRRVAVAASDARRHHLLAAAARRLAMSGDTLLSHESGAVFHRIGLLDPPPDEPRLTRHKPLEAGRLTVHDLYLAPVPAEHRVPGQPVTSPARTVADCCRSLPRQAALVTADSALRLGVERLAVLDVLNACSGWPGSAEALDLVMLATPWSESPLESLARLWFLENGLPMPQQQRVVRSLDGRFLARVDFVWEQHRTVCEMDGRLKYDGGPDLLWAEKLREDRLRDSGLEVVRGYWSDGRDGGRALAERLRRAFARGSRAAGAPAYRLFPSQPPQQRPLAVPSAALRVVS